MENGLSHWSEYGVKWRSVLNELNVHITRILPPDPTHDFGEGIIPYELKLAMDYFVNVKRYFSCEFIQERLRSIKFGCLDRKNITDFIRSDFARKESLGGNATKNLYLLRFLPLLVGSKVPRDDDVWECMMALREVVQMVYSEKFSEHDIIILDMLIREHRFLFRAAFPEQRFKPKHHYVEHYPALIREFGPLVNFQTIRFEAKHGFLKKIVHQVMNFKNICSTLANRHQLWQTYLLSDGNYFKNSLECKGPSRLLIDLLSPVQQHVIKKRLPTISEIADNEEIRVFGQLYRPGMFVAHGFAHGHPDFCRIDQILSVDEKIFFLCTHFESAYCYHYRAYDIFETLKCHFLLYSELSSFYPLHCYHSDNSAWIFLKYAINE